jgi:DMSO/TMAO reductase YedYZ molybdopterin-dependent catalytic subunit
MTKPATPSSPGPGSPRPSARAGALSGLIAAAAAMGVAQLVAGLTTPAASPVLAVGQAVIDAAPLPLKDWSTSTFGTADKSVLVGGVLVLLFAFAAVIGILAMRRLAAGLAGLAVFGVIGLAAVLTRPASAGSWIWPTLVGAAAGAFALTMLTRTAPLASPRGRRGAAAPRELPPIIFGGEPAAGSAAAEPAADAGHGDHDAARNRRAFLTTAGVTLIAAAAGEVGGRQLATRHNVSVARSAIQLPRAVRPVPPLPAGINPKVPGISSFITPNGNFYRVDTALLPPQVDPHGWSLRIHGMVAREIRLNFAQLLRTPLLEDYVTLCCVSNPVGGPYIGNAKWLGTSLAALLRRAGPLAGADQLLCTSVDGFTSGTPLTVTMDGRDALLAVGMNGSALPVEHGFPARLVIPGLYGYVSACKWVTDIEVTTFAKAQAYWVPRGWSQLGPIKTESRIDVPAGGSTVGPGRVTVAGVAWAQHKGVDAVEVRVNGGPWQQATLAAVPGIDTWRQWTWEWDATGQPGGSYLMEARATDATGYTQTSLVADVAPNGASGYPQVTVNLQAS